MLTKPFRWLVALIKKPARTIGEQLIVTVVGGFLFVGVLAGISWFLNVINAIDLSDRMPAFLVVLGGLLALLVGLGLGALIGVQARRKTGADENALLRKKVAEAEEKAEERAVELEKTQSEVATLATDGEAMRRPEAYATHLHLLLAQLRQEGVLDVERELLVTPAKIIEDVTGFRPCLSVWRQHNPIARRSKWRMEFAPEHSDEEISEFAISTGKTWLSLAESDNRDKERFFFGVPDLKHSGEPGRDLQLFLEHGYRSLCCASVTRFDGKDQEDEDYDENVRCLVALAMQPNAFSVAEQWYLVFLARILSLHTHISRLSGGAQDAAVSD